MGTIIPALYMDQLKGLQETSTSHTVCRSQEVGALILIAVFLSIYCGLGINQSSSVSIITITDGETEAQRSEAT